MLFMTSIHLCSLLSALLCIPFLFLLSLFPCSSRCLHLLSDFVHFIHPSLFCYLCASKTLCYVYSHVPVPLLQRIQYMDYIQYTWCCSVSRSMPENNFKHRVGRMIGPGPSLTFVPPRLHFPVALQL